MPRLISCGPRDSAYRDFKTADSSNNADYVAMLVDSEEPVSNPEDTWDHLMKRDEWEKPDGCDGSHVFLMTTCMETWIAADPDSLIRHYGSCLRKSSLPSLHNIEGRNRHEIQNSLKSATLGCSNVYQKNKRSFEIPGRLNPEILENNILSFRRMKRILNEKL
jgi:hypothetical protein